MYTRNLINYRCTLHARNFVRLFIYINLEGDFFKYLLFVFKRYLKTNIYNLISIIYSLYLYNQNLHYYYYIIYSLYTSY